MLFNSNPEAVGLTGPDAAGTAPALTGAGATPLREIANGNNGVVANPIEEGVGNLDMEDGAGKEKAENPPLREENAV